MQSRRHANCADAMHAAMLDEYEDQSLAKSRRDATTSKRNRHQQDQHHGGAKQGRFHLHEYYEQNPRKETGATPENHAGTGQSTSGHGDTLDGAQQSTSRHYSRQLHRKQ